MVICDLCISNTWKVGGSSGKYKGFQLAFPKIFGMFSLLMKYDDLGRHTELLLLLVLQRCLIGIIVN